MRPETAFPSGTMGDHDFTVAVLPVKPRTLRYLAVPDQVGEPLQARLRALADALSVSPLWTEMPRATLVVRAAPDPLLGVLGYFGAAGKARLEALRWQLEHLLPRLRYVGYAQAQEDCERLAARLVERFGRDELRSFRFVAIPRGGFIVLGMLAYILGLERSQLEGSEDTGAPLVVVDDCALSGVRFGEYLSRLESPRVVFAHLYSSPELREAVEARESGRVTCLSARDLRDHARQRLGEQHPAWQRRWLERMDGQGYWVGQSEWVCFAWNEPDFGFWNPVTESEENGWRFLPPDLCLKNRPSSGAHPVPVQVQPQGKGTPKPSSTVLFGEFEGQLAIGNLKTGESFVLEGVGADMWRAIVECGDLEEAADALLRTYDIDGATLRADLRTFVRDLLSQGLLEDGA
jgi:hypothetical protein